MKNDRKHLLTAVPFVLATVGLGLVARTLLGEHAPVILLAGFIGALTVGIGIAATVHLTAPARAIRLRDNTEQDTGTTDQHCTTGGPT